MHALTVRELLAAWEQGSCQSVVHRAVTLLTLTDDGEASRDELARISIGRRDARLLALRERAFGPRMNGLASCPACGLQVQLDFTVADIRVAAPSEPSGARTVCVDGCDATFRLPNSEDLAALAARTEVSSDGRALLELCLLSARRHGREVAADELPETVVAAISRDMGESDPQADVQLALACPECEEHWAAPLDIASFLWSEIHAWAVRLLSEVHTLAQAYGWREAEIVALSPWRRQVYLELIAQ